MVLANKAHEYAPAPHVFPLFSIIFHSFPFGPERAKKKVLMRDGSKRVANKGLELACFVAERLGRFPDRTGAFAFDWEPGDEEIDGAGDDGGGGGAWNGEGREEARYCLLFFCARHILRFNLCLYLS